MEKHPLHLKNPDLQTSPQVQRAVVREKGRKIPNNPSERIEVYMDRLEDIFLNPDERIRERNLEVFRERIYDALIIKKENFPDSYFELQKRIARERGQAVEDIPADAREQMIDTVIEDQRHSLDAWMDYLISPDAVYPTWFKYYVWNQIIKLSQFDKERGEFKKRTDSTVASFPDIYREPLAQIADLYERVKDDNKDSEARREFNKKFPTLYAELISKSLAALMENREEIRGSWVKYEQGDNDAAQKLFESLGRKGTGWCTAGKSTAKTQIESGDFYVYYTNDISGNPTQPRLAIRMKGQDQIAEIRGILPGQGVESLMQKVLDEKLREFGPEADSYRRKSENMRFLTTLEQKYTNGEEFTKDDLVFLYEINFPIKSFGHGKDPRIAELRQGRNKEEDIITIFGCAKEQVAHIPSEIDDKTKVYVGLLEPGIFQKFPSTLEHIYTSFPEKKIRVENVIVGGKSAEQLILEMEAADIFLLRSSRSMLLNKAQFISTVQPEEMTFVRLTVGGLGFKTTATIDQIFERAQQIGLELCPPDTGPNWRLKYRDQLPGSLSIGMKQITDLNGNQNLFTLVHRSNSLMLSFSLAFPANECSEKEEFAFRLRKSRT